MNAKKFIQIYENEIKEYRDKYYKNIINNSNKMFYISPTLLNLIPLIIAIIILISSKFTIASYIISTTIILLLNLIIYVLFRSTTEKNEYLEAIKKYGYHNIENYEKKLKKYISGPEGQYNNQLLSLIEKYNINSSTKRIRATNNEEFYIWSNKNKDKIYLLSTQTIKKPETKIIPISDIRYYRVETLTKNIILKTNNDIYEFKPDTINLFNELFKNKRLENIKTFDPGTYINDYEIYMHKIKKKTEKDYTTKKENFDTAIHNTIYLIVAITLIVIITHLVDKITNITSIINIFLIILLNYSVNEILNNIVKEKKQNEKSIIKELNTNQEHIHVFQELKYVLGINENYDRVYTKEGAEYITWMANGYFHVFLNLIYFNSVYMAIKASDVHYYKVNKHSCEVKLKNKTLVFTQDAQKVFSKLLPNKDYHWIKSYQKR